MKKNLSCKWSSRLSTEYSFCVVSIVSAICLSACSVDTPSPANHAPSPALAGIHYGVSLQRASLTGRDFESYKLLPVGVFVECGTVYRGRPETQFQSIEQPSAEAIEESKRLAYEIIERYGEAEAHTIDPRGSSEGPFDPGAFTLSASSGEKRIELVTSVDWVEQKRSSLATLVNRFAQVVRGLPVSPPCGNPEFYGIGRAVAGEGEKN
jgi:hypothetical protein